MRVLCNKKSRPISVVATECTVAYRKRDIRKRRLPIAEPPDMSDGNWSVCRNWTKFVIQSSSSGNRSPTITCRTDESHHFTMPPFLWIGGRSVYLL